VSRSGDLTKISHQSATILNKKLGIQCHIDFRSDKEIIVRGQPEILIKNGIIWKHFPLSDCDENLRLKQYPNYIDYYKNYHELIISNKEIILSILAFIATSHYDRFILSCYAGKDRTGVVVMLIMSILEINIKAILHDYVLTGQYLLHHINYFRNNWEKRGLKKEEYLPRLQPDVRSLRMLIENLLERYGSISAFLNTIGFEKKLIEKIKTKFFNYH